MKKLPCSPPALVGYLILGGKTNILADERDKQMLISQVDVWRMHSRMSVYAFCLTNDELHILVDGREAWLEDEEEADRFLDTGPDELRQYLDADLYPRHAQILRDEPKMRFICREIHQLPVTCGFSARIQDYWWSSYPSYLGIHDWKLLYKDPMLMLFGPSKGKATRQLRRYHEIPDIIF